MKKIFILLLIISVSVFGNENLKKSYDKNKVEKILEQLHKKDLELSELEKEDKTKSSTFKNIHEELKLYKEIFLEYKKSLRYTQEALISSKIRLGNEIRLKINPLYLNGAINKVLEDKKKRESINTLLKTIELVENSSLDDNTLRTYKAKFESSINSLISGSITSVTIAPSNVQSNANSNSNVFEMVLYLDKKGNIIKQKSIITQGVGIIRITDNNAIIGAIR